ncbi:MAG TPA: hypothetical protein VFB12_28070 [Ktedonobacteraceae bacterium]|nr:hypothetical protein [Ktedonobacteraceae bacterium]
MGRVAEAKAERRRWRVLSLEEQADIAEKHKLDDLFYCKDAWAMKHHWVNEQTGEIQRARCNRWECLYCGPRKVDLWRQMVKQAEPTLFLTLTKAGKTVEQARRALTTFIQALRRGSKGKGPNRVGARLAYLIEYFAVLERHKDFERNGFHWHLLIKGVDHIPYKEVIKPLWMSATHYNPETGEGAEIAHIERIRNSRAIGYVTKYLTKSVTLGERGKREVHRERLVSVVGEDGKIKGFEKQIETIEVTSKAHRICYSRQFFPDRVADLRKRLFAGLENETREGGVAADNDVTGKPLEDKEATEERPRWRLVEREVQSEEDIEGYEEKRRVELLGELQDVREEVGEEEYTKLRAEALAAVIEEVRDMKRERYRKRKRERLLEVLDDMNEGRCFLSRRVISIWQYQRKELRFAG